MGGCGARKTQDLDTARDYRGWAPKRESLSFPWVSGSNTLSFKDKCPSDHRRIARDDAVIRFFCNNVKSDWQRQAIHINTWSPEAHAMLEPDQVCAMTLVRSPFLISSGPSMCIASKTIHKARNPKSLFLSQTLNYASFIEPNPYWISPLWHSVHTHTHTQPTQNSGRSTILSTRGNQIWVMTLSFTGHQFP